MIHYFKTLIKKLLLQKIEIPFMDESLKRLKKAGLQPSLWVDVGAYQGEMAAMLRQTWPEATGVCFEGQAHALAHLQRRFKNDPQVTVFGKLAGSASKEGVILHGQQTSASVLEEDVHPQSRSQQVDMTTLDEEISKIPPTPKETLIKIDTQGYELEVLKGAEGLLRTTGGLILELNLIELHKGVPLADEVISWLKTRGFQMFDIAGLTRRPRDRALWQADFIFVPANSPLRSNKSYY